MKLIKLPSQPELRHDIEIKDGMPYLTIRWLPVTSKGKEGE